jgi:hemerythrin superfamily protein
VDATELLKHDHRMVEQLFRDYPAAKTDEQRRGVVEVLIRELSKHAALEELTVYPLAERLLPEATDVEEHLREHMAVKKTLLALDKLSPGDPQEAQLIGELEREIAEHVALEEEQFLPALHQALDQDELEALGAELDKAKQAAPTRPHPHAPEHPPALAMAAPVAAIYDRIRDRVQKRPKT